MLQLSLCHSSCWCDVCTPARLAMSLKRAERRPSRRGPDGHRASAPQRECTAAPNAHGGAEGEKAEGEKAEGEKAEGADAADPPLGVCALPFAAEQGVEQTEESAPRLGGPGGSGGPGGGSGGSGSAPPLPSESSVTNSVLLRAQKRQDRVRANWRRRKSRQRERQKAKAQEQTCLVVCEATDGAHRPFERMSKQALRESPCACALRSSASNLRAH